MAGKRCIIPVPRGRALIWAAAVLALLLAASGFFAFRGRDGGGAYVPPMLPREDSLDQYAVTLRLNPEEHTVSITETIRFTNRTGETLDTIALRTWLNAFETEETSPASLNEIYEKCYPEGFSPGGLALYDVKWRGEAVAYEYGNGDKTALVLRVPPIKDGETGEIFLRCVAWIPHCAYRTGWMGQDWQLGNVIPLLSRYEDGTWRTDTYSPVGDPFVSDCADFEITAFLPDGCVPCCSALLKQDESGAWRGGIRAARDAALCVSPDYQVARGAAAGTPVYAYAKDEAGAKRALASAEKALETFAGLFGPYPYPSLSVCSAYFPFGGMEYPALCLISGETFRESEADTLDLTVAHETAHQWFYGLVGSDQAREPWQDEALCEYAMLRYVRARYGQGSFETLKYYRVDMPMRENIPGSLTPGSPIDYFDSLADYSAVVYGRGTALVLALDQMLPGGVDTFLKAYAEEFTYGYASRARFEAFLNRYAGQDLSPLLLDYLDTAM